MHAKVLVLVKAAPVMTSRLDETMCVAGARLDVGDPQWIRVHPVPFRDLASDSRFAKYQEITLDLIRPKTDRRPESWTPLEGTISLGERIGSENAWADRRTLVEQLHTATMCELIEANRKGSGPGTPSLAVVPTAGPPELEITKRDEAQLARWRQHAQAAKSRLSLFDDPTITKPNFEVVPWRFRYHYRCQAPHCNGHEQTIVDWEIAALWRHVRHRSDWRDLMRQKLVREMWDGRATSLFVGNQEQHPASFLVLGIFWPPNTAYQPRMLG